MSRVFCLLFTLAFTLSSTPLFADILNVPDDWETIQDAIDIAEEGDTVLVEPGTYYENLLLDDAAITLGSLFLTTADEDYIAETIVDGSEDIACVTFFHENDPSQVVGFTIQNGAQQYGGGVDVRQNSAAIIRNCIIKDNYAGSSGGGIYTSSGTITDVYDTVIENNAADGLGGGIANLLEGEINLYRVKILHNEGGYGGGIAIQGTGTLNMEYVLVAENEAEFAGGVELRGSRENVFRNVSIVNNTATGEDATGGIRMSFYNGANAGAELTLINSILAGNSNSQAHLTDDGEQPPTELEVSYSMIEDGDEGIVHEEGYLTYDEDVNITEDPAFVDEDNGDYRLSVDSPCIDAGSPDTPHDPDGTIADMGALPFTHTSLIKGYVYDAATEAPLDSAYVSTSKHQSTYTDSLGYWKIHPASFGVYDISAWKYGYNLSAEADAEIDYDGSHQFDFNLLKGEISISDTLLSVELAQGDTAVEVIDIYNTGAGELNWSINLKSNSDPAYDHLELVESISASETLNNGFLQGVVFDGEYLYVSSRDPDRRGRLHQVYKLDRDGVLIDQFDQPNPDGDRIGMRDLAWDGEYIIGGIADRIYWLTTDGQVIGDLEVNLDGRNDVSALAYNPRRELLFVASLISDIFVFDSEGELVDTLDDSGIIKHGMGFWTGAPDEYKLLIITEDQENSTMLYRMDPETGDTLAGVPLTHPEYYSGAAGIYVSNDYLEGSSAILQLASDGADDRIDIRALENTGAWLKPASMTGNIPGGESEQLSLLFDARLLRPNEYSAIIEVNHDLLGIPIVIIADLTIVNYAPLNDDQPLPTKAQIVQAYPNPFNSTVSIDYALPTAGEVSLTVFDLSGRQVAQVYSGSQQAGWHTQVWQADDKPSGKYILRMEAAGAVSTRKLMLLK